MNELADLLWRHIQTARWFGGKGRPASLAGITELPWLTAPGALPAVRILVAKIRYRDDDTVQWYQVPVCVRGADDPRHPQSSLGAARLDEFGEVSVHDATRDPFALEILLALMLGQAEHADEATSMGATLIDDGGLTAALSPRTFGGEQSNTSIMYGDVAMLKLFRRLELGRNLDIEVHAALSGCTQVARLFGWLEAGGEDWHVDLGMLVEQLRGVRDGYELAVEVCTAGEDFTQPARALGETLRQVHQCLADRFETAVISGAGPAQAMHARLRETEAAVADLSPHHAGLAATFDAICGMDYPAQRVHGDFHLGQTLRVTEADGTQSWKIIDFEGEPLKTLAERRLPDTVWRDVAGMMRSFDYAHAAAIAAGADPEAARKWGGDCCAAFVDGYGFDHRDDRVRTILDAYLADKAIYEVMYEARNRPGWLSIPLTTLAGLAADHEPHTSDYDNR